MLTEQQKWIENITTFDMEILHKRGRDNIVDDALSRKNEVQTYAISIIIPKWLDEIQREYAKYPNTCALIEDPNRGPKF